MREYVFPINFNRKEKFLGMIDYKTLIFLGAIAAILFIILKNIQGSIVVKIYVFIFLFGIPAILSLVGFNGESMIDIGGYIIKFLLTPKVYVFKKED